MCFNKTWFRGEGTCLRSHNSSWQSPASPSPFNVPPTPPCLWVHCLKAHPAGCSGCWQQTTPGQRQVRRKRGPRRAGRGGVLCLLWLREFPLIGCPKGQHNPQLTIKYKAQTRQQLGWMKAIHACKSALSPEERRHQTQSFIAVSGHSQAALSLFLEEGAGLEVTRPTGQKIVTSVMSTTMASCEEGAWTRVLPRSDSPQGRGGPALSPAWRASPTCM